MTAGARGMALAECTKLQLGLVLVSAVHLGRQWYAASVYQCKTDIGSRGCYKLGRYQLE